MAFPQALPPPRTADSHAAPSLRWGLLGTGWIAERFAASLQRHTTQQVYAVGSRSRESALSFAATVGASVAHSSYEALVADPGVDVVYVATPHNFHEPHARLSIMAGKHTVVEKPLGLNAGEARTIAALAAASGVFCMEAAWTLFLPKFDVIRQLLADGALGAIHTVLADLGECFPPEHRIMRADLAGGPMLDLGTYPTMLATWVLGAPDRAVALGSPAPSGVNGQTGAVMTTPSGQLAMLHTSVLGFTPSTAFVGGSDASLAIDGPFYQPGPFRLTSSGKRELSWEEPRVAHDALHFEAVEAARCIAEGRLETPLRTLTDTVTTLDAMDLIRDLVGIVFDEERGRAGD